MQTTPKSLRITIGLFGRQNIGKSSVVNALTRQPVSIVSPVKGTTTDPVEKAMELLPLGPVLFIDTAGVDDNQEILGELRADTTRKMLSRCDCALLVYQAGAWGKPEEELLATITAQKIPVIVVANKADLTDVDDGSDAGDGSNTPTRATPRPTLRTLPMRMLLAPFLHLTPQSRKYSFLLKQSKGLTRFLIRFSRHFPKVCSKIRLSSPTLSTRVIRSCS